jgi:hypothetical protein
MMEVAIERHWNRFFIKKQVIERELDTFQTLLTDKVQKAIIGEELFQDVELDHYKIKFDNTRVKQELENLRKKCLAIEK